MRYLKLTTDDTLHIWTPELAARGDMIEINTGDVPAVVEKAVVVAPVVVEAPPEVVAPVVVEAPPEVVAPADPQAPAPATKGKIITDAPAK